MPREPASLSAAEKHICSEAYGYACAVLGAWLPSSSRMGAGLIADATAQARFDLACEERRIEITAQGLEALARVRWNCSLRELSSAAHARAFPERYTDDHVERFEALAAEDARLAKSYLLLRARIWDDEKAAPR